MKIGPNTNRANERMRTTITVVATETTTSLAPSTAMVPYYIAAGETFTVPVYKQALFSETIDVDPDGDLVVDGMLIEVD